MLLKTIFRLLSNFEVMESVTDTLSGARKCSETDNLRSDAMEKHSFEQNSREFPNMLLKDREPLQPKIIANNQLYLSFTFSFKLVPVRCPVTEPTALVIITSVVLTKTSTSH